MADPHHADSHDYTRGEMTIGEQSSTWALFMVLAKYGSLAVAAALTFLTVWFCTPAGFLAGLITGVIVFAAGFAFLRSGGGH
ncbi:aa3-type cytochrome c oxidase subunit IV [Brevundimonas sp. VNH65]|uniref:aa3-type cytochrome c oxidase subunit IV n=1 Tax=Brevundimonas sp. VNH65 TaxID=3400917 RepID=UPI003C0AD731